MKQALYVNLTLEQLSLWQVGSQDVEIMVELPLSTFAMLQARFRLLSAMKRSQEPFALSGAY
jgi:hypothetical protein